MKRDRLYELILALVLISLGLGLGKFLPNAINNPSNYRLWFVVAADVVAIFGVFKLLTDYLRRIKGSIIEQSDRLGVSPLEYEVAASIVPIMKAKKLKADDVDGVAVALKAFMVQNEKLAKKS